MEFHARALSEKSERNVIASRLSEARLSRFGFDMSASNVALCIMVLSFSYSVLC